MMLVNIVHLMRHREHCEQKKLRERNVYHDEGGDNDTMTHMVHMVIVVITVHMVDACERCMHRVQDEQKWWRWRPHWWAWLTRIKTHSPTML